jgi:hypothetical protein
MNSGKGRNPLNVVRGSVLSNRFQKPALSRDQRKRWMAGFATVFHLVRAEMERAEVALVVERVEAFGAL